MSHLLCHMPFAIDACRKADPDALRDSLGSCALMNEQDGLSLLELAIKANSAECVAILLSAGAPVNPHAAPFPISLAARSGSSAICSLLLAAGADPEARGDFPSPLMSSTLNPSAGACQALIDAGAQLDASSPGTHASRANGESNGRQAIHYAAQFASSEPLRALLLAGADPLALDGQGESAQSICLKSSSPRSLLCLQLISSFLEQRELSATADPAPGFKRPRSL